MKLKLILATVGVIVISVGVGVIVSQSSDSKPVNSPASNPSIPVGSKLAAAKAHSKGRLPSCLTSSDEAQAAVKNDDKLIDGQYPAFDLAATTGIIDVPAGTNVDVSIHSYKDKIATGSLAYPSNYGSYNFKIVPNTKDKPYSQWKMTYLVACKKNPA